MMFGLGLGDSCWAAAGIRLASIHRHREIDDALGFMLVFQTRRRKGGLQALD
jgi:hypothetical protein